MRLSAAGMRSGPSENREPGAIPGRYRHCMHGGTTQGESRSLGETLRRLVWWLTMCESGELLKLERSPPDLDVRLGYLLYAEKRLRQSLLDCRSFFFFQDRTGCVFPSAGVKSHSRCGSSHLFRESVPTPKWPSARDEPSGCRSRKTAGTRMEYGMCQKFSGFPEGFSLEPRKVHTLHRVTRQDCLLAGAVIRKPGWSPGLCPLL